MKEIIIGANTLVQMARQLMQRKEITQQQFNEVQKRGSLVPREWKADRVIGVI